MKKLSIISKSVFSRMARWEISEGAVVAYEWVPFREGILVKMRGRLFLWFATDGHLVARRVQECWRLRPVPVRAVGLVLLRMAQTSFVEYLYQKLINPVINWIK